MSVYLDTSVVVPLFVIDAFTDRARAFLKTLPALVISDFVAAEFACMVARCVRTRELSLDQAQEAFDNFDAWEKRAAARVEINSTDIRAVEIMLRRLELSLRAPDAIHIAVAQRLGAELVTFDMKMATAARALAIQLAAI